MTGFWHKWMIGWCLAVGLFGVVLATAAFDSSDALIRMILDLLNGPEAIVMTVPLRFAVALMGCVTIGWCLTFLAAVQAADMLGARGRPIWRMITASVVGWYVIDSSLSVATGFALNAVPNTAFLIAFLLPVLRTGVMGSARSPAMAR